MDELEEKRLDKLRDQLFDDLLEVSEKAQKLGVQHVAWIGLGFFSQMTRDCAPSKKEAKEFIKEAVKLLKPRF